MGARVEQAKFVVGFLRERAMFGFGARVLRDPLCRLHGDAGRLDPYPLYRTLQSRGPLSRSSMGVWASADHAVCHQVLRDRRFGVAPLVEQEGTPQLSFLEMNPPDHTRLRRFVMPTFSPRSVAAFGPVITTLVDDLLDEVRHGEPFDLISTLAAPMPIGVITALLGVPDADAAEFSEYGTTFGSALGGLQSLAHAAELVRARHKLQQLFTSLVEARREDPQGDDVISRVIVDSGGQVQPEEFVPLCTLLLIAGFETTVNLIGNTTLALLQHPDAWRRVVADPTLADVAVEETLRYDPPVQRTARTATEDIELAGRTVRRGEVVVVMIGGANRDPKVFADPDRFDLDRSARDHLAFSGGIHYCVGAPLARLEAAIAIRSLAARFPELHRTGPLQRRPGSLIRGMQHFEVQAGRRVLTPTP